VRVVKLLLILFAGALANSLAAEQRQPPLLIDSAPGQTSLDASR
jgi:hypothetical protein